MTEADWETCEESRRMLGFVTLRGFATERKRRLFVTGCFRRIWPLLADQRSREAIEVVEPAEGEDVWPEGLVPAAKLLRNFVPRQSGLSVG